MSEPTMNDQPLEDIFTDDEAPRSAKPASTAASRAARRRAAKRRTIIGITVGAVLLASIGAGVAYAATRPTPPDQRYVTVAAVSGDLTQTLGFSGTVVRANQASAAFPAGGTVLSVAVAVGDQVSAGQTLATMDATALQQAVDTAQANLDQAQLTLDQLSSASSTASAGASSAASAGTSSSTSRSSGGGTSSGSGSSQTGSQPGGTDALAQAAATAQSALSKAQDKAKQADQAMNTACAKLLGTTPTTPETPTPTPTTTPDPPPPTSSQTPTAASTPSETPATGETPTEPSETSDGTPSDTPSDSPTTPAPADSTTTTPPPANDPGTTDTLTAADIQQCSAAMQASAAANQAASTAASQLSQVSGQLAQALGQAGVTCQATVQQAVQTATQQATQQMAQQVAAQSGGSSSQTQQVAAQLGVDQAKDTLAKAQIDLANATLVSPIDGVVATLPFTAGETMTASDAAVIVGDSGVTVALTVPVGKIGQITPGQAAVIAELGVGQADGTVSVKNLAPAAAGGTNYTVTVTASGADARRLLAGVPAQVTITTGQVTGAVLVPVSAISLDETGTTGVVTLLADGELKTVTVQISAIGASQVAISQGVAVDDLVVVADTQEALPSSLDGIGRAFGNSSGSSGTGTGGQRPR